MDNFDVEKLPIEEISFSSDDDMIAIMGAFLHHQQLQRQISSLYNLAKQKKS